MRKYKITYTFEYWSINHETIKASSERMAKKKLKKKFKRGQITNLDAVEILPAPNCSTSRLIASEIRIQQDVIKNN